MRFDLNLRSVVREQIANLAEDMKAVQEAMVVSDAERKQILERIIFFEHTTERSGLSVASAQANGEFPSVCYGDSFIYLTLAHATIYESDSVSGLREISSRIDPTLHFAHLCEDEQTRQDTINTYFTILAGISLREAIELSDYRKLKTAESGRATSTDLLLQKLIRPQASDSGNLGIQFRYTAELGMVLRLLLNEYKLSYILTDGTLSLPLVTRTDLSLFYEHLKRLCCVEARKRGTAFFALSKSHGLSSIELLEEIAREKSGLTKGASAEHWFIRLPITGLDRGETPLTGGRRLSPAGAVTYLFRFHRTMPVMRLDMDREYWCEYVRSNSEEKTCANERRIFEDLDYTSHDQRCYGYPYPIKSSNDRASLTKSERTSLRRQIIDAGVRAGLKRSLFREATRLSEFE